MHQKTTGKWLLNYLNHTADPRSVAAWFVADLTNTMAMIAPEPKAMPMYWWVL